MTHPLELFERITSTVRAGGDASAYFDPNYVIYQDHGMPYGGEFKGAEGFVRSFRMVYDTFGPNCLKMLFQCVDASGEHASMHLKLTGPAGAAVQGEDFVTVVWTFRNDLALETRAYYYNTPRWCEILAANTK
jgi:hypothetical protein